MLKLGEPNIKGLYLGEQKIKKAYLGEEVVFNTAKPSRLPEGYTEIEYIQSSGTQYIDTKIKPTSKMKLEMDVEPLASVQAAYFGAGYQRASTSYIRFSFLLQSSSEIRLLYSSIIKNASVGPTLKRSIVSIDAKNNLATFDNTIITLSSPSSITDSNHPYITLLANNISGKINVLMKAKVYSCVIYDDDILIRNFVPCFDPSGSIGLYDLIDGKFYANSGTGMFYAGPAIKTS